MLLHNKTNGAENQPRNKHWITRKSCKLVFLQETMYFSSNLYSIYSMHCTFKKRSHRVNPSLPLVIVNGPTNSLQLHCVQIHLVIQFSFPNSSPCMFNDNTTHIYLHTNYRDNHCISGVSSTSKPRKHPCNMHYPNCYIYKILDDLIKITYVLRLNLTNLPMRCQQFLSW